METGMLINDDGDVLKIIAEADLTIQDQVEFGDVCDEVEDAIKLDDDWCKPIVQRYWSLIKEERWSDLAIVAESDMRDNYIANYFILKKLGMDAKIPVAAWAAYNRMKWQGFNGEIGLLRAMIHNDEDLNAPDDGVSNATALHMMCNLKYAPWCHWRAIQYLVVNGADVNAQTENGDTPLIKLCGNIKWNDHLTAACKFMIKEGANASIKANDGATALSLLVENDPKDPDAGRRELIELLRAG